MKTGTIVYLAGAGTLPEDFDEERALERAGVAPSGAAVLSASADGYYRLEEALLVLARRGASLVEMVRTVFDAERGLVVGAERTRLVG